MVFNDPLFYAPATGFYRTYEELKLGPAIRGSIVLIRKLKACKREHISQVR